VLLDATIVTVALLSIQRSLHSEERLGGQERGDAMSDAAETRPPGRVPQKSNVSEQPDRSRSWDAQVAIATDARPQTPHRASDHARPRVDAEIAARSLRTRVEADPCHRVAAAFIELAHVI
jgi:hypothetical protein